MANSRSDIMAPPWWKKGSTDYTKHRSGVSTTYTSPDAIIGRHDLNKFQLTTNDPTTVSGVPATVLK